jgi:alpha,alpha-trehalase
MKNIMCNRTRLQTAFAFLIALSLAGGVQAQTAAPSSGAASFEDVLSYVGNAWATLTRSMDDCKTVVDDRKRQGKAVLYFPADMQIPAIAAELERKCGIETKPLPQVIAKPGSFDMSLLKKPGLLYLPHPYVVPGGFFNEMYGWDSYFIIRGLIAQGNLDLAKGIVENFEFEIEHYGAILNANRTYFLTRSQPPFLSSMVLAVFDAQKTGDHELIEKAYPYIIKDYEMWTRAPHLAGNSGLSRYYDFGKGPAVEISSIGDPYFIDVMAELVAHPDWPQTYVTPAQGADASPYGQTYTLHLCADSNTSSRTECKDTKLAFTEDYYEGDRAMRESGFDISFRFGPYSGSTHHYAPVCLNSLLFKTEKDLQRIATILGRPQEAATWDERAQKRAVLMNKYFWDDRKGMFYDWNLEQEARSNYKYASTFYPLWAGWASPEQAKAVRSNLQIFEHPGGLAMSDRETEVQWDLPYGWAPIQLLANEGLRRYGFDDDANRLGYEFVSMVSDNFKRDGTIREKYNVVTRSDETNVTAGYKANLIGFGWTNGTLLALLHLLPADTRTQLEDGKPLAKAAATSRQ